jgi:hypothetical protein
LAGCGALNPDGIVFHRFLRQFNMPDEVLAESCFIHCCGAKRVNLL